jgi:hypothetical protein
MAGMHWELERNTMETSKSNLVLTLNSNYTCNRMFLETHTCRGPNLSLILSMEARKFKFSIERFEL